MLIVEILSWHDPNNVHRPQDIIDFLMARGGIKDDAGELRALDLHMVQKGKWGRLGRKNGIPLDYAREAAVEAGFLHPDSDINDLLQALYNNTHGHPVYRVEDHMVQRDHENATRAQEEHDDFWNPNNMFADD